MSGPRVGLIACGARKLDHAAPAGELYTGGLFTAAREYVSSSCDWWAILSARHGLVSPEQILEPYNMTMAERSPAERAGWAGRVDLHLRLGHRSPAGELLLEPLGYRRPTFVLLAGELYRRELVPVLERWAAVEVPLEGLGIGSQLGALKRARESLEVEELELDA